MGGLTTITKKRLGNHGDILSLSRGQTYVVDVTTQRWDLMYKVVGEKRYERPTF